MLPRELAFRLRRHDEINGRDLRFGVDEAESTVLAVATGELDVPQLAEVLERHLERG
ncbi:MAG: hypothetical protein M3Q43_08900 [Actinomycetota bacterium]|nr:hypothetical protein [Thermoleophilaceae bacterium]MDQ3241483.1 hypothetical protein [Actinomycetota bacterium]